MLQLQCIYNIKSAECFVAVGKSLEEEGILVFKDPDTIAKLKEENFDFALVDTPHHMLLAYKLSLPFAILGAGTPHIARRIPYLPRYFCSFPCMIIDSLSTKHNLQRKLNPNVTQIYQPMTDGVWQILPFSLAFRIRLGWV